MAQMREHLPRKHKAPSSKSNTDPLKNKNLWRIGVECRACKRCDRYVTEKMYTNQINTAKMVSGYSVVQPLQWLLL
jgi:hypothetical protein